MNQNICVLAPVCMLNSTIRFRPITDLSTLPVLPGDSRFCLLSPGFKVFYNFLHVFPWFQQRFLVTKMIKMTFFVTKFFVSVYKLTKTLKTIGKKLPMILIVINCLSNMVFC